MSLVDGSVRPPKHSDENKEHRGHPSPTHPADDGRTDKSWTWREGNPLGDTVEDKVSGVTTGGSGTVSPSTVGLEPGRPRRDP